MSQLTRIAEYNNHLGNQFGDSVKNSDNMEKQFGLVNDEWIEFLAEILNYTAAPTDENRKKLLKEACDIHVTLAGFIHRMGGDPEDLLRQVNNNNDSKLIDLEQLETEIEHFDKLGLVVDFIKINKESDKYAIISAMDQVGKDGREQPKGKGLKPSTYRKLDLEI